MSCQALFLSFFTKMTHQKSSIGARLRELRIARGLTQEKVSQFLGIVLGTYSRWERDKTEPSISEMSHLARKMNAYSQWIVDGTGPRDIPNGIENEIKAEDVLLDDKERGDKLHEELYGEKPIKIDPRDPSRAESLRGILFECSGKSLEIVSLGKPRTIPVVGLVHAGEFNLACDGNFPPGIADEYVVTDTPGRCLFGVRCQGDSMEPRFQAGDILIVNPELEPQVGDFVIIKIDGEVVFKRLVRHDPALVQLKSLNPNYPDLVLTPEQPFRIIGKVVERKTLF
jgi:SOS-response transcriptional repressor LexA